MVLTTEARESLAGTGNLSAPVFLAHSRFGVLQRLKPSILKVSGHSASLALPFYLLPGFSNSAEAYQANNSQSRPVLLSVLS